MARLLDVEDETILSNIFRDHFPESWQENSEFVEYLSELSSYSIDKLNHEPDRLAEERAQILEQTQDLAFHNYKTFIQTAECSQDIFKDFQIIEQHVGGMIENLPDLSKNCKSFLKEASVINTSRKMNNMTLERYTQLLEILEMPQLMDTCVRNNYYDEALELATHVKRMEKKHSNIPVIKSIVDEVKVATQLMLTQLISQLRANIQLPACLRIIGYLRRMDVFTEAELRIKFLQARDNWFQSVIDGIPTEDPYHHITKTVELSRVHLFDIFTQYRAIFSDEDPVLTLTKGNDVNTINEAAIFHGWVIKKVSQFLEILEADLKRGVGNRLDSVLGQCMYFGLSFSRVGADFRGLLVPIFQQTVLSELNYNIQQSDRLFEDNMQSYTLLGSIPLLPTTGFDVNVGNNELQPPKILMQYQPLGVYLNNLLHILNDLRLCVPVSLVCDVVYAFQQSLSKASITILAYHRAEEPSFNDQEREKFSYFVQAYCEHLVVFVNSCVQELFPVTQLCQSFGMSAMEISKIKTFGSLDLNKITESLQLLLPIVKEPLPSLDNTDSPDSDRNISEEINEPVSISEKDEQIEEDINRTDDKQIIDDKTSDVSDTDKAIISDSDDVISKDESADNLTKDLIDTHNNDEDVTSNSEATGEDGTININED